MTESTAVVQRREEATAIAKLLEIAVQKDMSVEGLEKLVALHERVADRLAAQDFADALATFQQACPPIQKTGKAEIVTKNGGRFQYRYAPLDEVARTVGPLLHQHGLSYGWDSTTTDSAVETVCTIRHRNGHRETARFTVPIEGASPNMSVQHKHAAALSYGRRQSLVAALGLSSADPDTDGHTPGETITPEQVVQLEEMFDGVQMSKTRFFRLLSVESERLHDIPVALFDTAVNLLREKKRAQKVTT